VYQTVPPNRI